MEKNIVLTGDCIDIMRTLPENSVDAIVTDPPYGIEFMGKEWDKFSAKVEKDAAGSTAKFPGQGKHFTTAEGSGIGVGGPRFATQTAADARAFQEWTEQWAREAFRVLKPGGHLLAFGGTRMYHRLASGVEDAGFEVRDMMSWLYGSGFPKSHDVSKAIDKKAGARREVVGVRGDGAGNKPHGNSFDDDGYEWSGTIVETAPATEEAKRWEGWGTALKPAQEPIVVARKPLIGTVAENVLAHGTGAINIDASRIGTTDKFGGGAKGTSGFAEGYEHDGWTPGSSAGRWPANILFDEEAAAVLDEQSGTSKSTDNKWIGDNNAPIYGKYQKGVRQATYNDSGGASRFFYVAKAGKKERSAGVAINNHPTVKPIALMGYLIKMVTPPGGVVLDPFLGSGTTACAAASLGFDWIGIERDESYVEIANARISHWQKKGKE